MRSAGRDGIGGDVLGAGAHGRPAEGEHADPQQLLAHYRRTLTAEAARPAPLRRSLFGDATPALAALVLVGFCGNGLVFGTNAVLQAEGAGDLWIGFSTALQALGIVIGAPLAARFCAWRGVQAGIIVGCVIAIASALVLVGGSEWVAALCGRLGLGCGMAFALTAAEYAAVARAPDRRKTVVIGVCAVCFAVGAAAAPAVFGCLEATRALALAIPLGALLLAAALIQDAPFDFAESAALQRPRVFAMIAIAPTAMLSAFAFGFLDNGILSLIGVFAIDSGFGAPHAALVAFAAFGGVVLFQVPMAVASERITARSLLIGCCAAAILCLAALPWAAQDLRSLAVLAVVFGGLCDGFYTVGLCELSRVVPRGQFNAGNACFITLCGAGEIAGPIVTTAASSVAGTPGLLTVTLLVLGGFLAIMTSRDGDAPPPHGDERRGAPMSS